MDTKEDTIWKSSSKSVVYSWIADYIFQETWEEFCAECSVDSETDRKLISGIVQKVGNSTKSPEFILKSSLLIFMSLLSDAKDDLKDKNGDFEETILERALTILESNLQVEQFEKELLQLARALKLQAVLCCCRRNEWTLAEGVSKRLWPRGDDDASAEQKIVNHILHSKKEDKNLDRYMTYPAFLQKTKNLLAKVVAQFSAPFLQKICQQIALSNSQETDDSEYQSAEEGDGPHHSQIELNNSVVSQNKDPSQGQALVDGNHNQNNATQESLTDALDLQRQEKAAHARKKVNGTEEQKGEQSNEEDLDVEISQIEIRERELRSRTVPGFVKQTMILKAPKKSANSSKLESIEKDEVEEGETQIDNEVEDENGGHVNADQVMEIPESEDEDEGQNTGSDGKKRKRKYREMQKEIEDNDAKETSGNLPVSLMILKHSFMKLGHGHQFWRSAEEDLGYLNKYLHEPEDCEDDKSTSPEEEPLNARKTTPVRNSFQRPLTFPPSKPSRLGRMKQLQTLPTNSSNGIFPRASNSSKVGAQAGPSGIHNGNPSGKNQRRKRLQELEHSKEEEEGERLTWNSSEDDSSDSDDSIGSMISKASLKSPKLRKSLEVTSSEGRKPWTNDEVRRLIKGVRRFGVGKWNEIKDHYEFDRTNVNLKDKWRNLVKKYGTSSPSKMDRE